MAIRLVVFDIDGTLIRTSDRLSAETAAAVRKLHDSGIRVALASARPINSMRILRGEIGVKMPLVGFNGAVVQDEDDNVVRQIRLEISPELSVALAEFVAGGDAAVHAYTSDGPWLTFGEKSRIEREERDTWVQCTSYSPTLDPQTLAGLEVSKILCDGKDVSVIADAVAAAPELNLSHSGLTLHDIWHDDSGKGNGVTALAAALGLRLDEVLTVGDSDTDVPMLELVPVSVMVSPGSVAARAAASHTAQGAGSEDLFRVIRELVATSGE